MFCGLFSRFDFVLEVGVELGLGVWFSRFAFVLGVGVELGLGVWFSRFASATKIIKLKI